jgi:UDP-N-acetylglucosamine 2-epimerase (non-hydrolysing)
MPIPISCVVGARPNFMKMAAILDALGRLPQFQTRLIHTGQHFSPEMSDWFFLDLGLPQPDTYLDAGGGTASEQTAEVMKRIEPEFAAYPPRLVLVVGDVNSTLAAALVAAKRGVSVAHVEAGLRSFDRTMPEEINRLATDAVSDILFASEPSGVANLRNEGVPEEKIHLVGNVMIDTLLRFRERSAESAILEKLGISDHNYIAVTLHRPANVDDPDNLAALMTMLEEVAARMPVVFPIHPRTRKVAEQNGISTRGLILSPPLGYLDFLKLESAARLVLTDSGGVQEETTILGVPCLTLRDNTERPVTISDGTNRLAGTDPVKIREAVWQALESPVAPRPAPELWDGRAAERIAGVLERILV